VANIEEIASWVAELLLPVDPDSPASILGAGNDDIEAGRAWLSGAAAHGLAVPKWPTEFGGRAATDTEADLIRGVLTGFAVPDMYPFAVGLSLVAPILLESGSDEHRSRWLRAIADGSEIWCQMFSEPDAGSDLANIAARAELDGDQWVISGQKVWTSRGPYSRWGMCLARTDPDQVKHRGLTMFALDMQGDGVEVRPLHQMNGDTHFSEVFVDEARVGRHDILGEEGKGWSVAMAVLTHERASLGGSGGGLDPSGGYGWLDQLASLGRLHDPVWRDRAMCVYAAQKVAALTAGRLHEEVQAGRAGGSGGSGGKLRLVEVYKRRSELMRDALGPAGMLDDHHLVEFLTGPSMSIRGGTDEVQRNIIGERVLGLPPEPRVDKGITYAELRKQGLV